MARKPKQPPAEPNPYDSPEFKKALKKVLAYKPPKKGKRLDKGAESA
jgi:hypothetical protein